MELSFSEQVQLFTITPIVGALLLFAFLTCGNRGSKKRYRLPPGPRPWPILGNLALFGPLLHQDFKKLADRYGRIVYVRLGSVDAVAISSPDLAEEILKTKDLIFASRPATTQGKIMAYECTDITFAPYGAYWRHARKVFTVELLTAKRIQQFQKMRKAEVLRGLRSAIDECKDGQAIRLDHMLWIILSRNIFRMALGKTVSEHDAKSSAYTTEGQDFENAVREVLLCTTLLVPGDFIPLLRHFDVLGLKKQIRKVAKKMDTTLEKIIDEHLQKNLNPDAASEDGAQDLLDVLLTRPASDHKTLLTRDNVKSLLQDVLVAGADTSLTTISWALTELLKSPPLLKRAQEELDAVVGRDRLVEEKDLPYLPLASYSQGDFSTASCYSASYTSRVVGSFNFG